jgi:hypothetical protein
VGWCKVVNEALSTCTVTYSPVGGPPLPGARPDEHGVSLKVTGKDLYGVWLVPAVGSVVRVVRTGGGGYYVADCNNPAKLVIRANAMVGIGTELEVDFALGTWTFDKGTEPAILGNMLSAWTSTVPVRPWCPLGAVPDFCKSKRVFLGAL